MRNSVARPVVGRFIETHTVLVNCTFHPRHQLRARAGALRASLVFKMPAGKRRVALFAPMANLSQGELGQLQAHKKRAPETPGPQVWEETRGIAAFCAEVLNAKALAAEAGRSPLRCAMRARAISARSIAAVSCEPECSCPDHEWPLLADGIDSRLAVESNLCIPYTRSNRLVCMAGAILLQCNIRPAAQYSIRGFPRCRHGLPDRPAGSSTPPFLHIAGPGSSPG